MEGGNLKEKGWGNGIPVGMSGYCLMMLLLGMTNLGYLEPSNPLFLTIAGIAIFGALFTGGMITLKNGNTLDGALLVTFSFMFVLGPTLVIGATVLGWIELPKVIFACWNLLLAAFIVIWSIPLLRAPFFAWLLTPLMFIPLVLDALALLLGMSVFTIVAGWFWLVPAVAWGLYAMLVHLSAEVGIVIPLGKPLMGVAKSNVNKKMNGVM